MFGTAVGCLRVSRARGALDREDMGQRRLQAATRRHSEVHAGVRVGLTGHGGSASVARPCSDRNMHAQLGHARLPAGHSPGGIVNEVI